MTQQTVNELDYVGTDDRIYNLVCELPIFTFKDVRRLIPDADIPDNTLYKAINRLVQQRRIRFVRHANRKKVYTAIGVSNLPVITNRNGDQIPLNQVLTGISQFYKEKRFIPLDKLNDLPIVLVNGFLVAQAETPKERLQGMREIAVKIADMREVLTYLLEWLETVVNHPSMMSEPNFTKVYAGNEVTPEQLVEFKRWLTNFRRPSND